jgi:hypothetical protein
VSAGGGESYTHIGYQVGGDWRVTCHAYDDTTPILSVDAGRSGVSITTRGKTATVAALEFARALAREARRFADEMERIYAAQLADDGNIKAAGSDAA